MQQLRGIVAGGLAALTTHQASAKNGYLGSGMQALREVAMKSYPTSSCKEVDMDMPA